MVVFGLLIDGDNVLVFIFVNIIRLNLGLVLNECLLLILNVDISVFFDVVIVLCFSCWLVVVFDFIYVRGLLGVIKFFGNIWMCICVLLLLV